MSELSNLKLKLNSMGKDRFDFDRLRDSEVCGLGADLLFVYTHTQLYTREWEYIAIVSKQLCLVKRKSQKFETRNNPELSWETFLVMKA